MSHSEIRNIDELASPAGAEDAGYWAGLLDNQPETAFGTGPLDFPRAANAQPATHRLETHLSAATAGRLRTLAGEHDAGLHALMLTILALEARRRTGRSAFVIGANLLPLPCHFPRQTAFSAVLRETQRTLAAGLRHGRYPFEHICRDFQQAHPDRQQPARHPLFDLAVTDIPPSPRTSPVEDMRLHYESVPDGGLLLEWHVNAALYTRETAASWFEALTAWAEWLAEDPARAEHAPPDLLPREAAMLAGWEQGAAVVRPQLRFHELFERLLDTCAGQKDRPAVLTPAAVTTYDALEREANAIAHGLLARGAAAGAVVGVLTGRSAHLPATVLGIWKAGATYLPLAAGLPTDRLDFMARDAGIAYCIALDGLAVPPALALGLPAPLRPEELDAGFRQTHSHRPPPCGARAADDAYIIYTSGSTGRPKGTLIGHQAYVNSVLGTGETLGLTPDDRSLMFFSPSFDASLSDIGLPLAFGGALCPVSAEVLGSPSRFRALLTELRVTVADVTPSYLRLFEDTVLPSLRTLVTGGEAPFAADIETYAGRYRYFNAYGPTENTITSTLKRLRPGRIATAGRPLPNTSVHVCDPEGNSVPPGVAGELWLGGLGLARGYVGRPELTAAVFVETPRGRRYRSGDLGRWRADGEIEILGRIDDQVKLNGIRVELGEIEHALSSHPGVAQAVALLDGDAEQGRTLWAFVTPAPGKEAPAEESWRQYLAGRLPAYMIPSGVIAIPGVPLSHSGKVDKAALRSLLAGHSALGAEPLPEPGLETRIARVWSELLGKVREVGVIHRDDDFFALGGHSLLAIAVSHRLEKALGHPIPVRELFADPTLRGFAERVRKLAETSRPPRILSGRATDGQQEFWVAEQAGLDAASNLAMTFQVCGEVPAEAQWQAAWAELVARHDALRTGFHLDANGVLRRFLLPRSDARLEIATLPDMPAALPHVRERQVSPFALGKPPLWRAGLVRVAGPQEIVFWLALHHAVGDGISLGVLVEELCARLRGASLPPLAGYFDEAAGREESYLAGPACLEDAEYWRKTLGGLGGQSPDTPQPFDEWPLDFPRRVGHTAGDTKGTHCFRLRLDASIATGLRDAAQKEGGVHTLMLAILAHEVRRRTGRPEFAIGTAASTRASADEARTVGYYVNILPVPCRVHAGEPFEELLRAIRRNLSEGLQHARYPFARIHRDFRRDHAAAPHPARFPLCDFAVTENPPAPETERSRQAGIHFQEVAPLAGDTAGYQLRTRAPSQDMTLVHESQPDGSLVLEWFVNAAIYEKETAAAWFASLTGWAQYLANGARVSGSPLPELLPEEEARLAGWERGPELPHPSPTLAAQFEYWARVRPERPALVTERGTVSYAALSARANGLAHALLELGVARQEPVGVFSDRSTVLPEVVLAIWKAGGCFLPLVPELPPERLAFMARDAGVRVLVVLEGHEPPASMVDAGCRIFRPESLPQELLSSHGHRAEPAGGAAVGAELACILYTSGSTGVPKGVMLQHRGVNNLGLGAASAMEIRSGDRVMLLASPAFDAWVSDLAMAWSAGAAVVPILRGEMNDIAGLRAKVARLGVSTATMTPSYLRLFEQAEFPCLRLLMTMGEPPHAADARHYAGRLDYFNGYGPTECSAAVSYGQVTAGTQSPAAGRPLVNTVVQLRGSRGERVPPGALGEIWVSGVGLASGYLNRPDLTAASFLETPAGRFYRTGDSGRWLGSGELKVLGRSDGQVKVRGQRVELDEIELRLEAHAGVRQAVAAVETAADGTPQLWAFVCLHAGAEEPTPQAWHEYLSRPLPSYMLPSAVLRVPAIPVGLTGKADRGALLRAASGRLAAASENSGALPRDGVERQIADAWMEHLRLDSRRLTREDDFFQLGGDSLCAIAVVNRLRRTLQCSVNDLYEHPRLADFAAICQPQPEHLRMLIQSAASHWQSYRRGLADYERERQAALTAALAAYEERSRSQPEGGGPRPDYRRVLLTGATGYLGSYLLRELLGDDREVTALVRGADDGAARLRLGGILMHYFGREQGGALRDHPRLTVLAGDLRRDGLGLPARTYDFLADSVEAVFHSAANVKHFGHYREFHAGNVSGTARLLQLAGKRAANPADFHFVSTLSVCGRAPEQGFRLFTEDDPVPERLDENFYIRSKQEAERLVAEARGSLANACIHRVGNLVFAASGGALQFNLAENAFFRQLAAYLRLGVAPDDAHLWLCHVDAVARGLVRLADAADLANQTHHLENARMSFLADFVASEGVRACSFDAFLERLERAVDDPAMDAALAATMETFGLYRGQSPQARARRLEIVSMRTQARLARLGLVWPETPDAGRVEMLRRAAEFFARPPSEPAP
jgi:amino acid adenylation domain-containing protein/thioester reductase-like protein